MLPINRDTTVHVQDAVNGPCFRQFMEGKKAYFGAWPSGPLGLRSPSCSAWQTPQGRHLGECMLLAVNANLTNCKPGDSLQ